MANTKRRGNGQGYVIKVRPGVYKAIVTIGYKDDCYKQPIKRTKSGFPTKGDAIAYLPYLKQEPVNKKLSITLKNAFDKWIITHKKGKSTINCYKAGFRLFEPYWNTPLDFLDIDELQSCFEKNDVGTRTRENAKAALGLVYKWAIPRGYVENNVNLAQFLVIGDKAKANKHGFTAAQLDKIRQSVGIVPLADYIYCACYLGFRPSELLALEAKNYDPIKHTLVGGAKTEAGKDRIVTISPKIQPIIANLYAKANGGFIFGVDGKKLALSNYRLLFYHALDQIGIQKEDDHTITPHCCRHTFATLMKAVQAPDKDKMRLIGHASAEQLRYYQDVNLDDLRKITDLL